MLTRPALLASLLLLGAPRIGHAEDARSAARVHYAKGLELAGQNGYEGALQEFNQAYALSPQYAVLYNIGQAHVALGHATDAIDALTRYLADGGDRVTPDRRAQVQRQIAMLQSTLPNPKLPPEEDAARLAAVASGAAAGEAIAVAAEGSHAPIARSGTLIVRCGEPGLRLTLDGKRLDQATSSRGLAVALGVHHLVLALPGRRPTDQSVEIPANTSAIVLCENLATLPAVTPPRQAIDAPPVFSPISTSPTDTAPPTIHARTIGYFLTGLGAAVGGTAIGVYFWNRSQYHDAEREQTWLTNNRTSPYYYEAAGKFNSDADALHRNSVLTVGLAGASVGLLAGGVYLLLRDRKRGDKTGQIDKERSWASLSPGGVAWNVIW